MFPRARSGSCAAGGASCAAPATRAPNTVYAYRLLRDFDLPMVDRFTQWPQARRLAEATVNTRLRTLNTLPTGRMSANCSIPGRASGSCAR